MGVSLSVDFCRQDLRQDSGMRFSEGGTELSLNIPCFLRL